MKNSYLSHLDSSYNSKTFQRKVDYIKYNFGSLIEKIKTKKNVSVLEIGPGKGEFINYLNTRGIKDIDIMDNDKEVLDNIGRSYKINNTFYSADVTSIENRLREYDLIVLVQVLEHISPEFYFPFIKTVYLKLKAGGHILVVVPNANNPLGLVERYGDLQHKNAFTEQSLKDLVVGSGIDGYDIDIKGYSIPPYDLINIIRIVSQKILHLFLLAIMVINGGTYFKIMSPNITLIIKKTSFFQ